MSKSAFEKWYKTIQTPNAGREIYSVVWLAALQWALRQNRPKLGVGIDPDKLKAEIKKIKGS